MTLAILGHFLTACTPGRYADREVQICLRDDRGIADFRAILVAISKRHALEFFDQSEERERTLSELKSDLVGSYPLRDYHLHDKSAGVEISASNLGQGRYQTALSWDLRSKKQQTVANDLTKALERQFILQPFPPNSGALPLKDCPDGPSAKPSPR